MTKLCVGLDVASRPRAVELAVDLADHVDVFKIGLELFCAEGPALVEEVAEVGREVFLDLKINDIPKQSSGAVRAAEAIGASYVTVHGNAGRPTLEAVSEVAGQVRVLVVSVLTSLDAEALGEIGVERPVADQVGAIAALAAGCGAHGLVLSTGELGRVRARHEDLLLVTPGIRPQGADVDDQRRVGSPAAAVAAGSDMLVVARPIVAADDPVAAARSIREQMREVVA